MFSRGLITRSISGLLSGGYPGARQQMREYRTYRANFLPGYARPKNTDEAKATVMRDFQIAREAGLLRPANNEANLLLGHEFSRNGYQTSTMEGDISFAYDASQPLEPEIHAAMMEQAITVLRSLPEGIIYCPGTCAIDTGRTTPDGRPIGENRGFIASSGPAADAVEFTKNSQDQVDNWSPEYQVETGGELQTFTARDLLGDGRSLVIGLAACSDFPKIEQSPIQPDVWVAPSAGWPGNGQRANADVLVCDALHNPFGENDSLQRQTGVWAMGTLSDPLRDVISALVRGSIESGLPLLSAFGLFLLKSDQLAQYLHTIERGLVLQSYEVKTVLDTLIVCAKPRELPDAIKDMQALTDAVFKKGATILDLQAPDAKETNPGSDPGSNPSENQDPPNPDGDPEEGEGEGEVGP